MACRFISFEKFKSFKQFSASDESSRIIKMTITESTENSKLYTLQEVALRDGKSSKESWVVVKDMIYDITNFMEEHPGGVELLCEYAGTDCTKDFNDVGHSPEAIKDMKLYKIGELVEVRIEFLQSSK